MEKIKFTRVGLFPLRNLKIKVNNESYLLKGNQEIEIILPTKEFDLELKIDWWQSIQKIKMGTDEHAIVIKFCLPDIFFISGLALIIILGLLTYLLIIPVNSLVISVLIFVFLQGYYLFINPKKYFGISVR